MKAIYLLIVLAFAQSAWGQDFCSLVKKEVSPDNKTFDFSSPYDPDNIPAVRVTRSYNNDPDYPADNFYVVLQITGDLESIYTKSADGIEEEKQEKSVVVTFDDSSKIVDDSIGIIHDRTTDMLQAIRYVYFPMNDERLKDFTTKKIAKFSLGGYEQNVPADSANAIMHYVQCISAVKK